MHCACTHRDHKFRFSIRLAALVQRTSSTYWHLAVVMQVRGKTLRSCLEKPFFSILNVPFSKLWFTIQTKIPSFPFLSSLLYSKANKRKMRRDEMMAHPSIHPSPNERTNERLIDWFIITESLVHQQQCKKKKRDLRRCGLAFVIPHVARCSYKTTTRTVSHGLYSSTYTIACFNFRHSVCNCINSFLTVCERKMNLLLQLWSESWILFLGAVRLLHRLSVDTVMQQENYLQLESFSPLLLHLVYGDGGIRIIWGKHNLWTQKDHYV